MTNFQKRIGLAVAVLGLLAGTAGRAQAGIIVTITQLGSNVVLRGGGTANLTNLSFWTPATSDTAINPELGIVNIGPKGTPDTDLYTGLSGPGSFGSGSLVYCPSGTGVIFGISGSGSFLTVPRGYHSGSQLNATSTYANQSFASLGVTPGTYVWSWGSGANADTFTLQIVPEPSSLISGGIAILMGLGYAWWGHSSIGKKLYAKL